MKPVVTFFMTIMILVAFSCTGGSSGDGSERKSKARHAADTGFTGTRSYTKGGLIVKEVRYSNGIREGLTKTFYRGGATEQEIMYSDNARNGEAKWFYPDGKLFRVTPYENDTINGAQVQYYKNGNIKARINYINGIRVPQLEEFAMSGAKITDYPTVTYRVNDIYNSKGVYKVFIEMSDLTENVKYYRGDFVDGLVDLSVCNPLLQTATTGYLDLKKSEGTSADSVTVIAAYLTGYGNRIYYRLAIPLPYKDLN
jgi:antitoxin component YwqK of YwqJK toxin-antitoxin module